jgi:hypothetical protein
MATMILSAGMCHSTIDAIEECAVPISWPQDSHSTLLPSVGKYINQSTRRHILQNSNLHSCCEAYGPLQVTESMRFIC